VKTSSAIYPGTFDPVTNGHLDIIERSSKLFGQVVVAILVNPQKEPLFSSEERAELIRQSLSPKTTNVEVAVFQGLLVDYANERQADVIIRGIRAVSDYEYELQMALMNRRLRPEIETFFMLPAENYSYLSSRLVREISENSGSIEGLVPAVVEQALKNIFRKQSTD
jgi:pantetheine-phosphate adenylyltransferase